VIQQEVTTGMIGQLKSSSLGTRFHVAGPATLGISNSIVLLKKKYFTNKITDVSDKLIREIERISGKGVFWNPPLSWFLISLSFFC
jgi:hypothetical protein